MDHAEKLDEAMTQVRIRLEETVSQGDLQEALESVKSNVLGPLAEVPGQLVQMREEHERAAGKMEGLETEVQGKVGHDELEARLEGVEASAAMFAAQAVATGGAGQEQGSSAYGVRPMRTNGNHTMRWESEIRHFCTDMGLGHWRVVAENDHIWQSFEDIFVNALW